MPELVEPEIMEATVNGAEVELTELDRARQALVIAEIGTKTARDRVREALPECDAEQLEVVLNSVRAGQPSPEGFRPNKDFVLNDLQKIRVKDARKAREAEVATVEYHAVTMEALKKETILSDTVRADKHGGYKRNLRTYRSGKSVTEELKAKLKALQSENAELKAQLN